MNDIFKNKRRYAVLFLLAVVSVLIYTACNKDEQESLEQPDFIRTTLSATLTVEGGEAFDLSVPQDASIEAYEWTVPDLLTIVEGQGSYKITVKAAEDGGIIPERSISVIGKRAGKASFPRIFYQQITILTPPPTLEGYTTKRYGSKVWMTQNLNEAGENGDLGWAYNNDPQKADIYGRLYTWHEAMTGIPHATAEQNPYQWGSEGVDDAGKPYVLDGSPSGSFNIQIQGACPMGWHVPNVYDWYDLMVAIKSEYQVPGNSLNDVANSKEGYIIAWDRDNGFTAGLNLTNWGVVGPYLKAGRPIAEGGLWQGGTTFHYGGNSIFPDADYPLYVTEAGNIAFDILPSGRWNGSKQAFEQEGLYSYHWTAYLKESANHYPLRLTVASGNANFSNGEETPVNGLCLRCVLNY